jgi:hypothetical protein
MRPVEELKKNIAQELEMYSFPKLKWLNLPPLSIYIAWI